jgi:NitT/TauT family transport system ATP-binding protein
MIRIDKVTKSFSERLTVLAGVSFDCKNNQITSLIGPSGGGKTTLLNLISKLDKQDHGDITIESHDNAPVGYMMQDPLMLPWRTLSENSLVGAEVIGTRSHNLSDQLSHYFEVFDLGDDRDTYPLAASAGMKQRVALIRTLLISPSVLLLDEPFSNLDFDIKLKVQSKLIDYQLKRQATILLVTHDIEDAIALSDKVVVLSDKPTTVKSEIAIDLGLERHNPVEARKSPKFREYFIKIWDQLKYLHE